MSELFVWAVLTQAALITFVAVGAALAIGRHFQAERARWARLTTSLQARYGGEVAVKQPAGRQLYPPWRGVVDGVPVTVTTRKITSGKTSSAHLVVCAHGLPLEVLILPERMLTMLKQAVVGEDVQTGDPAFDAVIHLRGPQIPTLARCDRAHRAIIRAMISLGARAQAGAWTWSAPSLDISDPKLAEIIGHLVQAARVWRDDSATDAFRLTQLALHDPIDGVRAQALSALMSVRGVDGALPTALEALGDTAWAAALRPDVARPEALALGVAAAVCAAARGGPAEVPGLHAWASIAPASVRPTFAHAIAAIHARVDPEVRGGLSVASAAAGGELSPAAARGDLGRARTA
jgi:hypothetical protein